MRNGGIDKVVQGDKNPQRGVFCKPNEEKISRGDTEQLCQIVLIGQVWWVLRTGQWTLQNWGHWWFLLGSESQAVTGVGLRKNGRKELGNSF